MHEFVYNSSVGEYNGGFCVCVHISHYPACMYINLFAAVQVWIYQQNYTVTEGGAVNITLVTNTVNYEFNFTVTLLPLVEYYWYWYWYGYGYRLATGESCSVTYVVTRFRKNSSLFNDCECMHPYILFSTFHSTAASDYEAGPYTVTFTAGDMYATLMVPTMDDNTTELSEYFKVAINSTDQPSVVEIGTRNKTVIPIEDNDPGIILCLPCLTIQMNVSPV